MEIVLIAGVVVSGVGAGLGWFIHHQNRVDKKKEKEKQEADRSIGVNVAAGHFYS
jgi:hypothetical protein